MNSFDVARQIDHPFQLVEHFILSIQTISDDLRSNSLFIEIVNILIDIMRKKRVNYPTC